MKHLLYLPLLLVCTQIAVAEPSKAVVTTSSGTVEYALPNSNVFKKIEFKETLSLPPGSIIRTSSEGVASVSPFPGAHLTLIPNSTITLESIHVDGQGDKTTTRQASIELATGTLKAVLNRKAGGSSPIDFKIKTANCVAAARGTKYTVVTIGGTSYIKVLDGTVTGTGKDGSSVDLTKDTGVGVVGPDGKITIVPFDKLPPDVQKAFNDADTIETTGQRDYLPGSQPTPTPGGGGGSQAPKDNNQQPLRPYNYNNGPL